MFSYCVFGGHLRSELPFPELRSAESERADWTLRVSHASADRAGGEPFAYGLGSQCQVVLNRELDCLRLYHSCTGSFDICNRGREILWTPRPGTPVEAGRADVLGRVLAVAMHLQGVLTLHASAVALDTGAIAFIAPKRHGKSTLAMALTRAGARVVTDDALPIKLEASPTVMPGVQSVRLHEDSATSVCRDGMSGRIGVDGKRVFGQLDVDRLLVGQAPLTAIYVLSPVNELPDSVVVRRTRLPAVSATMALVTHMKVGALLGTAEASVVLDRSAALARAVPVYRLEVVRDLQRLGEVAEAIYDWHEMSATVGI